MDISSVFQSIWSPILLVIKNISIAALLILLISLIIFFGIFLLKYPFWKKKYKIYYLRKQKIKFMPYDFLRWKIVDFMRKKYLKNYFHPYGFTIYCGRQGSGKTISMIKYLNDMHEKYPKCLIVTNFSYKYATHRMESWRDLLEIRNGVDGVIFAIDEIHSEYSSANWKDFPENLLSEISQQRKQKIKIVATSQVFSRVAKPIREQAFSVVCCDTYFGRYTKNVEYDAGEYSTSDTPYQVKKKVKPLWKSSYIQSDFLRNCFDTFEKIERMKKITFLPRSER